MPRGASRSSRICSRGSARVRASRRLASTPASIRSATCGRPAEVAGDAADHRPGRRSTVNAGYPAALGIRLAAGRLLADTDVHAPPVALVNERFVRDASRGPPAARPDRPAAAPQEPPFYAAERPVRRSSASCTIRRTRGWRTRSMPEIYLPFTVAGIADCSSSAPIWTPPADPGGRQRRSTLSIPTSRSPGHDARSCWEEELRDAAFQPRPAVGVRRPGTDARGRRRLRRDVDARWRNSARDRRAAGARRGARRRLPAWSSGAESRLLLSAWRSGWSAAFVAARCWRGQIWKSRFRPTGLRRPCRADPARAGLQACLAGVARRPDRPDPGTPTGLGLKYTSNPENPESARLMMRAGSFVLPRFRPASWAVFFLRAAVLYSRPRQRTQVQGTPQSGSPVLQPPARAVAATRPTPQSSAARLRVCRRRSAATLQTAVDQLARRGVEELKKTHPDNRRWADRVRRCRGLSRCGPSAVEVRRTPLRAERQHATVANSAADIGDRHRARRATGLPVTLRGWRSAVCAASTPQSTAPPSRTS